MTDKILSKEFVQQYANKNVPWGFNGMGEIVYRRTYARDIPELGRKEEWHETLERCVNGAQEIGAGYTPAEAERLFDLMFHLKGTFSGRALWQLGTDLVRKYGGPSMVNCLAGETEVITATGNKQIKDLVGQTATLMTTNGKWVDAPIKNFGKQKLLKLTLRRSKITKVIYATPEHRWFAATRNKKLKTCEKTYKEVLTKDLNSNHRLQPVFGQGVLNLVPSVFGQARGVVFGDGSKSSKNSRVTLCGQKDQVLLKLFPGCAVTDTWAEKEHKKYIGKTVHGLPGYFKEFPSLDESKSYLYGWLSGYFAADGCVDARGSVKLASSKLSNLEFVRNLCQRIGIGVYGITHQDRKGIDGNISRIYTLTIIPDSINDNFFLIDHHKERFQEHSSKLGSSLRGERRSWNVVSVEATDREEEVFCAVVPETHAFALDGNILTGNCYYTNIEQIRDFEFLMDHLMLGGGVGFSIERAKIHSFPKVKAGVSIKHERTNDADLIVPDSRQGWSRLLHSVLKSYLFTGKSFTYSTILVRGYGAPLKSFGGTASGPEVLIEGIKEICDVLGGRVGKKLRSVDVLDICNIIGKIVVAGSSRRSAQIALGDPDDVLYLRAKNWASGNIPAHRANSNNSVYADSYEEILDLLWKGYDGSGEPYGLINRKLASMQGRLGEFINDSKVLGCNPCVEIFLEDGEPCNLAEIYLPNISNLEELLELSKLLYKCQKAITGLKYPYKKTQDVVARNRRLGQGITGWMQSSPEQLSWIPEAYRSLREFDKEWSTKLGIPASIKLTAVKPSGTLSLLAGVTPGIHPGYAKYYIRRVRMGSADPLVEYCRKRGYHVQYDIGLDGKENYRQFVVAFPCESKEGTVLAKQMTAIEQLEWVVKAQTDWADNAVSVTVYYRKEELPGIQKWLEQNYEKKIKSVSFLLHSEHGFALPPYEEISEEEYRKMLKRLKDVQLEGDLGNGTLDVECEGGVCPIR